MFHSADVPEPG